MDRSDDPVIPPDTEWLHDRNVCTVCDAIAAGGGAAYFVGGCVRDALLGRKSGDVDLATDSLPEDIMRFAQAAGLKAVPTGLSHGTVTIVSGGRGMEVTTFRRDVRTNGRHAEVVFSKDMTEDARRRDFTLNALYARPDGRVLDPLGSGLQDCYARRIRFIGNASHRIREDYLRVLRFFRFHAWYAQDDAGFDPDALDAIARSLLGLETLSAERIGAEMMRLLAAPSPARAVAALAQTGALAIVLPGADPEFLAPYVHLEELIQQTPDALARLASLGGQDVPERLRLSRQQAIRLNAITTQAWDGPALPEIAYRHGVSIALPVALLRAVVAQQTPDPDLPARLEVAANQRFPIVAADLMPAYSGKALGDRLRALEDRWIASDFSLSHEDLMNTP